MSKALRKAFIEGVKYADSHPIELDKGDTEDVVLRLYPNRPCETVRDIVVQWLKDNGYDGLYNDRCRCWCDIEAIAPCNCIELECRPGVLVDGKVSVVAQVETGSTVKSVAVTPDE